MRKIPTIRLLQIPRLQFQLYRHDTLSFRFANLDHQASDREATWSCPVSNGKQAGRTSQFEVVLRCVNIHKVSIDLVHRPADIWLGKVIGHINLGFYSCTCMELSIRKVYWRMPKVSAVLMSCQSLLLACSSPDSWLEMVYQLSIQAFGMCKRWEEISLS